MSSHPIFWPSIERQILQFSQYSADSTFVFYKSVGLGGPRL
jgi:hypothetical protein